MTWLLLPTCVLAGWVTLADGQDLPKLTVCRHRSADGQDARPIDLGKVDREYSKAAAAFRERMKTVEQRTAAYRDQGYSSGLKACSRAESRELVLREALPARVRGRRLYFLAVPSGGRVPAGLQAPLEPDAVVFLLQYPSLEEAGKFSQLLGVGATPATPALAERLGIRCMTTIVDVARDGRHLTIQEIAS
jgi:hypothetical protein